MDSAAHILLAEASHGHTHFKGAVTYRPASDSASGTPTSPATPTATPNWASQSLLEVQSPPHPSLQGRLISPVPGNIPPKHGHLRIWVSPYLPAKLNSWRNPALTWVRHENHNNISRPAPRHCGSSEDKGERMKPGTAGLGLECDSLPNNYMLSAVWDHTLESVPQGESAPCLSQYPLPVFSINICNGDFVGSEGKPAAMVSVCVWGGVRDSVPGRRTQARRVSCKCPPPDTEQRKGHIPV